MARIKPGKPKRSPMVRFRENKMEVRDRMVWLLDFLNKDIDSLKTGDFLKLVFDFAGFIYALPTLKVPGMWGTPEERILLKQSQGFLRKRIKNILLEADTSPEAFGKTFDDHSYSVPCQIIVSPDRVFKVRFLFPIWPPPFDETFKAQLFDAMIEVLSQFHLSRIKTCQKPGCGKYFYRKSTKGEGNFCSPRCQNWARTHKWRQKYPDKYNEGQRKWRAKAKEPWIRIECLNCGHEYPKGHSDPGVCSKCGGKLRYEVMYFEERKWRSEEYRNFNEAEEYRRDSLEYEKKERGPKDEKG